MPILLNCGPSEAGWSRIAPYTLCQRLFFLTRERRTCEERHSLPIVGPQIDAQMRAKSGPLARGSVGHVGMAHLLMRKKLSDAGEDPERYYSPTDAMQKYAVDNEIDEEAYLPPMMALGAWDQRPLERVSVVAVEQQAKATVGCYSDGSPMILTTRWDALLRYAGSPLVYSFDHKFMTRHSEETVKTRYTLSGQFLFQNWLGRANFGDCWGGVVIHAIEAREPYRIAAYPLDAAPAAIRDFKQMVKTVLQEIKNKDAMGYTAFVPSFNEQTCSTAYGECAFFNFCQWGK